MVVFKDWQNEPFPGLGFSNLSLLLLLLYFFASLSSVRFAAITATTLTFTLSLSVYKNVLQFFFSFSCIYAYDPFLSPGQGQSYCLSWVLSLSPSLAFFLYTTFLSLKL
jgi:hypothetical protein